MLCEQMFAYFSQMTAVHGSAAAGMIFNGSAWTMVLVGCFLVVRLTIASIQLERGLAPYLSEPSPKLARALDSVLPHMPNVRTAQFFECPIPSAYSSVFGLLQVRCVLSSEYVQNATDEELVAVVAHEASHLSAKDVWATLFVGMLNCLFFALRPVRNLSRRWREATELACDEAAVAVTQNPRAMATAILRMNGLPCRLPIRSLPATTIAFADEAACAPSIRVQRLISQARSAAKPVPRESSLQLLGSWSLTIVLTVLGLGISVSPEAACYAHCAMESVARLLP